jgi:hypothetical protein
MAFFEPAHLTISLNLALPRRGFDGGEANGALLAPEGAMEPKP